MSASQSSGNSTGVTVLNVKNIPLRNVGLWLQGEPDTASCPLG